MSRAVLIVAIAAAIMLLEQGSRTGDQSGEGGPTAGDDSSNILSDGAGTLMGMITGWFDALWPALSAVIAGEVAIAKPRAPAAPAAVQVA